MKSDELDATFSALSSELRRRILDLLEREPGCNVNRVAGSFEGEVGRFAVMKHLAVLEDGGLVVSLCEGRGRRVWFQARTGMTVAELHAVIAASGLAKTGERRSLLMEKFKLGYGDANAAALFFGKVLPALDDAASAPASADAGDPLDAIYAGAKAPLRPLHEAVMGLVKGFGPFEAAPKQAYLSLRRKKQFAMVGPATKDQIEIGLNAKALPPAARLKAMPPGGMCPYTVRIAASREIDAELKGWLRAAYDAAG